MKHLRQLLILMLLLPALGVYLSGCADLSVENLNEPDTERVLATPDDVKNLLGGGFLTWWGNQYWSSYGMAMLTMADQETSSWGNFGMKDLSSEPRGAFNNNSTYRYNYVNRRPWERLYSALSTANDVLKRLDQGLIINTPEETQMVRTAAKLLQGLSLSQLGLYYDRAFIVDENTDVATLEFPQNKNYMDVVAAAIKSLDEAIALAGNMTIPFPDNYINGYDDLDGEKVKQFASTVAARTLMLAPRWPEETAQVDWNRVLQYARNGLKGWDFAPEGDANVWWDGIKIYAERPGWAQADLELVGADPNLLPALKTWLSTPLQDRTPAPFEAILDEVDPADARIPDKDGVTDWMIYEPYAPFRPNRGTYHFSRWRYYKYGYHNETFTGPMPWATEQENDLMIAEALIRTGGDRAEAAALINKTRVGNGNLPPVTPDMSDQELLEALMYERRIEIGWTAAGIGFADRRRFEYPGPAHYDNDPAKPGIFQHKPGTLRHFPIPGRELEVLQQEIYTYGGTVEGKRDLSWIERAKQRLEKWGFPEQIGRVHRTVTRE